MIVLYGVLWGCDEVGGVAGSHYGSGVTCLSVEAGDGLSVGTGDVPQCRSG